MNFYRYFVFLIALSAFFSTQTQAGNFKFPHQKKLVSENRHLSNPETASESVAINTQDPYESFNRSMYEFNMSFHDSIGRPVVRAYKMIPQPARTGVSNFLSNLYEPVSALNSFLQGNLEDGFGGIMRFTINTTFGLLGILDIATEAGLPSKDEDFGQTLFVWGVWDEASYLVLPFLGPTTTRNFFGDITTSVTDPSRINEKVDFDQKQQYGFYLATGFNDYVKVAPLLDDLKFQPDAYIFSREGFIQFRNGQIYNGHPPVPKALDDFDID